MIQETRRWDENKDATFAMRSKENAQDYRYFPEPDIPPLELSEAWLTELGAARPEMAEEKQTRYRRRMIRPRLFSIPGCGVTAPWALPSPR